MKTIVEWQEKVTESGIEIAGGPTTVARRGFVISSNAFPIPQGPGQMGFVVVLVVGRNDGKIVVVNAELCHVVEEEVPDTGPR
jgi:hypothetical protein